MIRFIKTFATIGVVTLGLSSAPQAHASVTLAGTRVILNAKDREATIKVSNAGELPALTQSWIDDGDAKATPSSMDVPFTVTPPVARIEPGKAQTLRILYDGEPLPQDKESVYWLNVLDVPPKPSAQQMQANQLQMAIRTRIKLFFRPDGLKGSASEAPAQVRWRLTRQGSEPALEGHNPTPFHVSVSSVTLASGAQTATSVAGGMIAPGKSAVFPLGGNAAQKGGAVVRYQAVNDYGGLIKGETTLDASQALPAR